MQEAMLVTPQLVNEVRSAIWVLGGGMSFLIIKEVFSFVLKLKKSGGEKDAQHVQDNAIAHALHGACLGRVENALIAQTAALIEITAKLANTNRASGN